MFKITPQKSKNFLLDDVLISLVPVVGIFAIVFRTVYVIRKKRVPVSCVAPIWKKSPDHCDGYKIVGYKKIVVYWEDLPCEQQKLLRQEEIQHMYFWGLLSIVTYLAAVTGLFMQLLHSCSFAFNILFAS